MLNMLWYLFRTQRKSNLQCLQYNITYILSLKIINTALKFQWKKHKCKSSLKKVLFCFSKVTKVIKVYKRLLSYCMINLTPHCIWTMSTANKGQREDYFFFFFLPQQQGANEFLQELELCSDHCNNRNQQKKERPE